MRSIFSALSLLVVLAIVGLVAFKQLKATRMVANGAAAASAVVVDGVAVPVAPSRALTQSVPAEVGRALEQGAAARQAEAGQ